MPEKYWYAYDLCVFASVPHCSAILLCARKTCFLSGDLACSVWPCVGTPPAAAVHGVSHCDLSFNNHPLGLAVWRSCGNIETAVHQKLHNAIPSSHGVQADPFCELPDHLYHTC